MTDLLKLVIYVAAAVFSLGFGHPGNERLHKHNNQKPSAIEKLMNNLHSVEELLTKQEERLSDGFRSLTRRMSNIKTLAERAGRELHKKKFNCSIPLAPINGHILGLDYATNGAPRLPPSGVIFFACDDGYHLVGSENRSCSLNGTWSVAESPVCVDITPKLIACKKLNCLNGGICSESEANNTYRCNCRNGFRGKRCHKAAKLIEKRWKVIRVQCRTVQEKEICSCPIGYSIGVDRKLCFDVDECLAQEDLSDPEIIVIPDDIGSMAKRYARKKVCRYQCRNTNGSYKCLCPPGYVSDPSRECRDVNECEGGSHNCSNEETCFNTGGSFQCIRVVCPDNYFAESSFVCRRNRCSTTDKNCLKNPVSYTYNYIELPPTLSYPADVFRASEVSERNAWLCCGLNYNSINSPQFCDHNGAYTLRFLIGILFCRVQIVRCSEAERFITDQPCCRCCVPFAPVKTSLLILSCENKKRLLKEEPLSKKFIELLFSKLPLLSNIEKPNPTSTELLPPKVVKGKQYQRNAYDCCRRENARAVQRILCPI